MVTHGRMQSGPATKAAFVCDNDINAIMRRMDADGDEEISFVDESKMTYNVDGVDEVEGFSSLGEESDDAAE